MKSLPQPVGESAAPVTEATLSSLPLPVARYLRKSGVVGSPSIRTVFLRQRGRFKMSETSPWARMTAEQRYVVHPPAFEWRATILPMMFAPVKVVDGFTDGHGRLRAKLFGLVTVAEAHGAEIDRGELLRFMSEIIWFPTAWLSDYITWNALDDRSAEAVISYAGVAASATLSFDREDRLFKLEAMRHSRRLSSGEYSLDRWEVSASDYRAVNGLLIPMKGQAFWKLAAGDFVYFDGELTLLEYDGRRQFSYAAEP